MSMAVRTLLILPRLTCCGVIFPASLSRPRCSASSWARCRSASIQASLDWVSWKPPIFCPNCSRVRAYSAAASRQVLAAPVTPQAIPYRASVRQDSGPFSPVTPGSTASAGSRTSSKCSSEVTDARRQLLMDVPGGEAARPAGDQEATDPVRRLRPDHGDIGDGPVGDPHLGAREDPVVPV